MVKFHTFSDRTIRYNIRCNKKFSNEMSSQIKTKNVEISSIRRENVDILNKFRSLNSSYNFIYKNYTDLYNTYCRLVSDYNTLKRHELELINNNNSLKNENEVLKNTQSNTSQNLKDVDTLEDWERLQETNVDPDDEYYKCENENENENTQVI
jgi:regulator of replication initiation timing